MTKDPAIAEHYHVELRELAVKGTKYRESFVGIRPVPKEVGRDTAEGRIDYMFGQALQAFVNEAETRHDIPSPWLAEWRTAVAERISEKAKELSEEERQRLMVPRGAVEPTTVRRGARSSKRCTSSSW